MRFDRLKAFLAGFKFVLSEAFIWMVMRFNRAEENAARLRTFDWRSLGKGHSDLLSDAGVKHSDWLSRRTHANR